MKCNTRKFKSTVYRTRLLLNGIKPVSLCCAGLLIVGAVTPGHNARADIGATHTTLVSEFASFNTPGVVDGRVEAIAIDGDTVFVGGTFTEIQEPLDGEKINQPYLFAYSKSTGNIIRTFDPVLDNSVFALETTGEGTGVFAGGIFGMLNGQGNNRGLVKLDDNGDRAQGFVARPDALVSTMVRLGNMLYIGGNFETISSQPVENLAALNTATGALDQSLNLDFDGVISTFRNGQIVTQGVQGVDDIDITSDGRLMVAVGNFETVDGFDRKRFAVIELDGQARVSDWNTDVFDVQCPASKFPQYIRGIDIAPDNSYVVTGQFGFRRVGEPACDTVLRFELDDLTNTDVQPTWVNYTGGDSVYEVVATDHAIYAGGHFRWLNNDTTADTRSAGPGSVQRAGLAALDPKNGLTYLNWQSDRNPRGLGTFALIAEDEGLYIGDDTDFLNGTRHAKLKFLPISSNAIQRPDVPELPATLVTPNDNALDGSAFDGTTPDAPAELLDDGWADARGAFYVGDQLFHADDDGVLWMSQFNTDTFEPRVAVDLLALTENEWALSQLSGMYFDPEQGRVYYTLEGDSQLLWRAFTPDGPYFGNEVHVAEQQSDIRWNDISGMDAIGGHLYFALTDGNLYRAELNDFEPVAGTSVAISGRNIDGRTWDNNLLAFVAESAMPVNQNGAEIVFESSGTDTFQRFSTFEFPVEAGEPVVVRLAWLSSTALLDLRVRDAKNVLVASDTTLAGSPKWLTVPAGDGGIYTASVQIQEGSTSYTLEINPDEQPPEPRATLADIEFSSTGSENNGRFQVFRFDVEAGDLVEAQVSWNIQAADVRVFLRDETNTLVERDVSGAGTGSGVVSTVAQTGGQWSVAVQVNESEPVEYNVLVDTVSDFTPPEPLADFEFSSTGSANSGRFQVFRFNVTAGELVETMVLWDDTDAPVRVFLRDETGTQIDRDSDGGGLSLLSVIAETTGQWSVAVQVNNADNVDYDVLVNTTTDFEAPEPLADFEFSSSGSRDSGRFQVFRFDVTAGELVETMVIWDDQDADVRVFLRDETGTRVNRDTEGGGLSMLSVNAETSGQWSVAVQINDDNDVAYDVLVDTSNVATP